MRALIVNNFTPRNLGDAAIVEGLVTSLRDAGYSHVAAAVMYPHDEDAWRRLGVDEVLPSLFLARGRRPRQIVMLLKSLAHGFAGLARLAHSPSVMAYRRADVVISVGGGYLGAARVLTNLLAVLNLGYAKAWRKRTLAAPMSMRPASKSVAFILRRGLRGTRLFARDSLSAKLFSDAGLDATLAPDLIFRAPTFAATRQKTQSKTMGWAPRNFARDHRIKWSDDVAIAELRKLVGLGYRIALLTQCTAETADDRQAVARIARQMPEALVITPAASLEEAREQYASVDALLGSRMHAALGAILTGTPALAVSYEEKVVGLFSDLGIGDWAVADADGIADKLLAIIGQQPRIAVNFESWDQALGPVTEQRIRPAIEFAKATMTDSEVGNKDVLEVGSWAIQGTARSVIEGRNPRSYVGIDVVAGPGVDEICHVEELLHRFGANAFDVVFATEVVEHIRDWRAAFRNMMGVLRPGGLLLITTRSPGYPYHGSPHDYWRYEIETMRQIFRGWTIDALLPDPDRPGVFIAARKTNVVPDLDPIELYAVALGRNVRDVSTAQVVLHRVKSPRRLAAWLVPNRLKPAFRRIARVFGYSTEYRGPSKRRVGGNSAEGD